MAQSRYWVDNSGFVTVTRADGSTFSANPLNIAVESELYTRFLEDGTKDTRIEEWFAQTIDKPATRIIEHLMDPSNVERRSFRSRPDKKCLAQEIGFRVNPYLDWVSIPFDVRQSIAEYVSALLVRHPNYLSKLLAFHKTNLSSDKDAKNCALDNMLELYERYRRQLLKSVFLLTKRVGHAEYIYADGGLSVEEPWRTEFNIPFDIHAPLTPDLALQVLPVPLYLQGDLSKAAVGEATTQGIARQNRIILGGARRFVFSRQRVSTKFITENFGRPAPKNIGYSINGGRLEASYNNTKT